MWRNLFFKEGRLLATPVFFVALAVAWFALGWFLLQGLLEYQAIAPKLAMLQNKRGATETLLARAGQLLQWLMILWSLYFGARSLAQERQFHTDYLLAGVPRRTGLLLTAKMLALWLSLALLAVPFWLFVVWVGHFSAWDNPLLAALAVGQVFLSLYAAGLALTVSAACQQALPASLLLALLWLLLWLAPVSTTSPLWLVDFLRWFSPFEHSALLSRGILSTQTGIFLTLHVLLFATLMPIFWNKENL